MFAFQSLDARHFIVADDPLALLSHCWGLLVQLIEIFDPNIELRSIVRGQPIANEMRFKVRSFLKDVRHDGLKC